MPSSPSADTAIRFQSALVVDDHPLFLEALAITLRTSLGIVRIETADTLAAAQARLSSFRPDVVVLDLDLPDVSGFDGLARLRDQARAPVMIVSSMAEPPMIAAAIRAGASGFVPKHSSRETYRAAFEALAAGRTFVPPGITLEDAGPRSQVNDRQDAVRRLGSLTQQQARILGLVCEGMLNKQIAYELSIAETTVKAHITAIMRKLGVQSRTQAVLIAGRARFDGVLSEDA